MIMTKSKPKKEKNNHLLLLVFLLIITSVCIIFLPYKLNTLSKPLKSNFPSYNISSISKIISYFGTKEVFILIISLFYNLGNIYQIFILFFSLMISELLIYLFKLAMASIIWIKNKQVVFNEINNTKEIFSGYVFEVFIFYLIQWKIFYQGNKKAHSFFKYFFLFINLTLVIALAFIKFLQPFNDNTDNTNNIKNFSINNNRTHMNHTMINISNSININGDIILKVNNINTNSDDLLQIFFAFLFGIWYYFLLFCALKVDISNYQQLLKLIKIFNKKVLLIILIPLIGLYAFFFYKLRTKTIEILYPVLISLAIIEIFVGLRNEYKNLDYHTNNWKDYNFQEEIADDSKEEQFLTNITITKPIKWNYTSKWKTFLRIVLTILFLVGLYFFTVYFIYFRFSIKMIEKIEKIVQISSEVRIGINYILISFGLFHLFKSIFNCLKLNNLTYDFLMRKSV